LRRQRWRGSTSRSRTRPWLVSWRRSRDGAVEPEGVPSLSYELSPCVFPSLCSVAPYSRVMKPRKSVPVEWSKGRYEFHSVIQFQSTWCFFSESPTPPRMRMPR
jgi:hypothetical protein